MKIGYVTNLRNSSIVKFHLRHKQNIIKWSISIFVFIKSCFYSSNISARLSARDAVRAAVMM